MSGDAFTTAIRASDERSDELSSTGRGGASDGRSPIAPTAVGIAGDLGICVSIWTAPSPHGGGLVTAFVTALGSFAGTMIGAELSGTVSFCDGSFGSNIMSVGCLLLASFWRVSLGKGCVGGGGATTGIASSLGSGGGAGATCNVCRPDAGSSSDGGATPIGGRCVSLNALCCGSGRGFDATFVVGGAGFDAAAAGTGFATIGAVLFNGGLVSAFAGRGGGLLGKCGGFAAGAGVGGLATPAAGLGWSTFVSDAGAGGMCGCVWGSMGTYRGGGGGSAGPVGVGDGLPSKAS